VRVAKDIFAAFVMNEKNCTHVRNAITYHVVVRSAKILYLKYAMET
jgi:hypothetical protein